MAVAVLPPHLGAEYDSEAAYMGISMEDLPLVLSNPCREACKALLPFCPRIHLQIHLLWVIVFKGVLYWDRQGSNDNNGLMTAFRMFLVENVVCLNHTIVLFQTECLLELDSNISRP